MAEGRAGRLIHGIYARGRAIYPLFYMRRRWLTRRPATFNQKIRYKMIRDRRPLLTTFADKVAARRYVADRVGESILAQHHVVTDAPLDVDWDLIPAEFAYKVSHGSGGSIVVWSGADPTHTLPPPGHEPWSNHVVRPEKADRDRMAARADDLLQRTCGWGWDTQYEWAYKHIPPRLIIEELLVDRHGHLPRDYRFHVFNGIPKLVQLDSDWLSDRKRRDFFTPQWDHVPLTSTHPRSNVPPPAPAELQEMLDIAATLGAETDYVRVDLYNVDGRIVFGELTNYPVNGAGRYEPKKYERILGDMWILPSSYRNLPSGR